MFTAQQIDTVIDYNKTANIFRINDDKRVTWDVRNGDVANLQQLGVEVKYAEDFAKLKKQVRAVLKQQQLA